MVTPMMCIKVATKCEWKGGLTPVCITDNSFLNIFARKQFIATGLRLFSQSKEI
jgi:hypothetical protein